MMWPTIEQVIGVGILVGMILLVLTMPNKKRDKNGR